MSTIAEELLSLQQTKTNLSAVIIEKGGTVPTLFSDYSTAIRNIPSGESSLPDVEFIDYDGTRIASYSFEEVANLDSLPELPTREGFTNEGWNFTLSELKAAASAGKKVIVGCTYITSDGVTRIYVTIPADSLELHIAFGQSETKSVIFDWGDGTVDQGPGSTAQTTRTHTYQQAGDYVISFTPKKDYATLKLGGNIGGSGAAFNNEKIKDVALGKILSMNGSTFSECDNLSALSIPEDIELGTYVCDALTHLKAFVIPRTVTSIPGYFLRFCSRLEKVSIPPTTTSIGTYCFYRCSELKEIRLVNVSTLSSYSFHGCTELEEVQAKNVSGIPFYCFAYCGALRTLDTDDITEVMGNAFYMCESLESIGTATITSFGSGTNNFAYCNNLSEVGTLAIPSNSDNSNRPTIGQYCFAECKSLHRLVVAPDDSSNSLLINNNAFFQSGIDVFDFTACTKVPELANQNAFSNTPSDKKILVPASLESTWKTATNWTSVASNIIGVQQ